MMGMGRALDLICDHRKPGSMKKYCKVYASERCKAW